jgi:hypothetical protein
MLDELIALYEANGLDCQAGVYAPNELYGGMPVVGCDGPIGDSELLVEARYGGDEALVVANFQLLYADYPAGDPFIPAADRERALRVVAGIGLPGRDAPDARERLIESLEDPDCVRRECTIEFEGGHWTFSRSGDSGWMARLLMDIPTSPLAVTRRPLPRMGRQTRAWDMSQS